MYDRKTYEDIQGQKRDGGGGGGGRGWTKVNSCRSPAPFFGLVVVPAV